MATPRKTRRNGYRKGHSDLYKPYGNPAICFYCGEASSAKDHVPALESLRLSTKAELEALSAPFYLVAACTECNSALGALPLYSLAERSEYIKTWLLRRYKQLLLMPAWQRQELELLGRGLADYILQAQAQKERITSRILFVSKGL